MSRDDIGLVRHTSWPAVGESSGERPILNRMGALVVTNLVDQLVLAGLAYHMQIGTEDAGVASTTSIDDALVWMLADNLAGYAMIPLLYEVNVGVLAGATLCMSMLEIDKDKVRYSSGGTAYVPANLRSDDAHSATGSFYVGTDITAAAKTAVPNTVEFARKEWTEDALADTIGYPGAWNPTVYSIRTRPMICVVGVGSVVCHHGAATADATGYGVLQFAQFDKALVT